MKYLFHSNIGEGEGIWVGLAVGEMDLVEVTASQFVGVIEVSVSAIGGLGVADLIVPEIDGMATADECDVCCINNSGIAANDCRLTDSGFEPEQAATYG